MNELKLMQSEKFGTIRTICEGDKVLYCGADVASALGYTNPRKALSDHCKGVTKRYTPTNSGVQQMSFIPEADVYRLICHSKLPSAMEFEKWVFEDVVPKAVNENLNPEPEQHAVETSEYHYFKKTLNGEPVLTLADFSHYTGVTICSARHTIYLVGKAGTDYTMLSKRELAMFKVENPSFSKSTNSLVVIKKPGTEKLAKYYGCGSKLPEMVETRKPDLNRLPSAEVKELMEKVQNEARAIDGISHLLLCPNTEESFNKYRMLLIERIIKLNRYHTEIAFAKN